MGIASALLGENNPFTQWVGKKQNFLGALGAGLMSGQNVQSGLANAAQLMPQAQQLDQAAAEKLKADQLAETQANATKSWLQSNHPDLAQMVDAGMPVAQAWQSAMDRMQPGKPNALMENAQTRQTLGQQYGLDGDDLARFVLTGEMPGGNQSVRASVGQPVYMRHRTTGEWGTFAPMSDGSMINQLTGQIATQDEWIPDPAAAAGAKTGATVDAKTAAEARAAMPSAEAANFNTQKAIAELRMNEAGMNQWFSQIGPRGIYIDPGSPMGKFYAAAEPTNNQAFMQAREALKGGGQITDFEGRKAEDAFSRMRAAMEKGDQDQYLRALADFEEAVALGYQKLREKAQGGYSAQSPNVTGRGGNQTSTGVTWSIDP